MDNKISTYSPAFSIVSWIALVGGIVTYLLGLWNAEMQLNEKGYYFAVLVLGLFSAASYQKFLRRLIKRPFGTSMKAYRPLPFII